MGMFDYVRCEKPLPDGYQGELQTKDFDEPYLLTHVITADGRLMQCVLLLRLDTVPKAERPYPDAPDNDVRSIIGCVRSTTEMRDANYHGMLHFYGSGHAYEAKFTDGQLVEIRLISENT